MESERSLIRSTVNLMAESLASGHKSFKNLRQPPEVITQLDCHDDVIKALRRNKCNKFRNSPFINELITPIVNLCEQGADSKDIIAQMNKYC